MNTEKRRKGGSIDRLRRVLCLGISLACVAGGGQAAAQETAEPVIEQTDIAVVVDGVPLELETPPVMEAGRTLVPMRALFETLGAEVSWEEARREAAAVTPEREIVFAIDNPRAAVNGWVRMMDVPARLVQDKTMVPLRFLSENLGYRVDWDEADRRVRISSYPVPEGAERLRDGAVYAGTDESDPCYILEAERSGYYFIGIRGEAEPDFTAYYRESPGTPVLDDFTALYAGFGEEVPAYITERLEDEQGFCYRRYYLKENQALILQDFQGGIYALTAVFPKDGDIAFRPVGGGKFITANNPEDLTEKDLADRASDRDYQPMLTLRGQGPDRYTLFAWHINNLRQDDIYVDYLFHANVDTTVRITGMSAGIPGVNDAEWTCSQAYADYKGWAIQKGDNLLTGAESLREDLPMEWTIPAGQDMWYSAMYEAAAGPMNYPAIPKAREITTDNGSSLWRYSGFYMMDFEIVAGELDFSETCYVDRGAVDTARVNRGTGAYKWDYMHKGVADTVPEVRTELYASIDPEDTVIPVTLYNSYNPMGMESSFWFTHLNPQCDPYTHESPAVEGELRRTRDIAAESDLLHYRYDDGLKEGLYQEPVTRPKQREWYFDPYHTLVREPVFQREDAVYGTYLLSTVLEGYYQSPVYGEFVKGFRPNDLLPRLDEVLQDPENHLRPMSFSLAWGGGNYGVLTTYDLKLENRTDQDKLVEFHLFNWQDNVVRLVDNRTGEAFTMATGEHHVMDQGWDNVEAGDRVTQCIRIPAGGKGDYSLSVILVTADPGGMKNFLTIKDAPKEGDLQ